MKKLRTLVYHPAYKDVVPCVLIGSKRIAQKYGWKVGDLVEVIETPKVL
jgi:hypothetical protein